MKTDLLKVVWLGCVMATVLFGTGFLLNVCADEQPKNLATAKTNSVSATNKPPAKPTDPGATPDEKKRDYKADTKPGTIFQATPPMAMCGSLDLGYRTMELVMGALASIRPESAVGDHSCVRRRFAMSSAK